MNYEQFTKEELIRLLEVRERDVVGKPNEVMKVLEPYSAKEKEHMIVVLLDSALQVIRTEVVSIGLVNRTIVHPREIFCPAVREMATAVILAHNHPSGNITPSQDDIEVTETLKRAGNLLGIKVVDHVIFAYGKYHSMAENGELFC